MKKHSLTVGFNEPKNPGTHIEVNLWLGGKSHVAQRNSLHVKYNGTSKDSYISKRAKTFDKKISTVFIELRAKSSSAEAATKHAATLKELLAKYATDEFDLFKRLDLFQVSTDGDNVVVGAELLWPDFKIQIPNEIHGIFEQVDQHVTVQLDIGASLNNILTEEVPLVKHLQSGFRVKTEVHFISNARKALLEVLKDDNHQAIQQHILMGAPAMLFQLNGNVQLDFDDFEEIEEHPMAAPILATFEQLFEGAFEVAPSEISTKTATFDAIENDSKMLPMAKDGLAAFYKVLDFIGDISDNIVIQVSSASEPISACVHINSNGIGAAGKLAIQSIILPQMVKKTKYAFDVEDEESLWK